MKRDRTEQQKFRMNLKYGKIQQQLATAQAIESTIKDKRSGRKVSCQIASESISQSRMI